VIDRNNEITRVTVSKYQRFTIQSDIREAVEWVLGFGLFLVIFYWLVY
jgi:hypothetical protein